MASEKQSMASVLHTFYDGSEYTTLFAFEDDSTVRVAYGQVGGQAVYAVYQNGGALSVADVDTCSKTLELAAKTGNPVVTFYNAKGADLREGIKSLAAAARLTEATAKLSGVVPQIAVVCGVCGASAALAAASADLCVMTKEAELFLSSPFLSAAMGDKVEGAGSAQAAKDAGIACMITDTAEEAATQAAKLVMMLPGNNLSVSAYFEYQNPTSVFHMQKYTAEKAVDALADDGSVVELFGGFGSKVSTYLATIGGKAVGVIATAGPDKAMGLNCVAKAARFVRLCDAFSIPLVTVLNTAGFRLSSSADISGNLRSASRLAATYADATTAKITVLAGKAVGTVYTAMAGGDITIAVNGAVVAPVEPSAAVSVLYKKEIEESGNPIEMETAARIKVYEQEEASAKALMKAGFADMLVEPEGARQAVMDALQILESKRTQRLPKKHGNMAL